MSYFSSFEKNGSSVRKNETYLVFPLQIEKNDLHLGKKKSYCQCAFVGFSSVLLFSNFYILLIQVKDFF